VRIQSDIDLARTPPFLPLTRAASALPAVLWRPLREAMTEAAMSISGLLAEIMSPDHGGKNGKQSFRQFDKYRISLSI
jgi:hypothetical protein